MLFITNLYSQQQGDVYISKDSLSQFQFIDDNKVFYTLYTKSGSPYILRKTVGFIDNFHIDTEKFGLGNYHLKSDSIFISFNIKNNFKDSLKVSCFEDAGQRPRIKVKQRNYFSGKPSDMVTVAIVANDSTYTNLDDHDFYVPINRKALPYKVKLCSGFSTNEIEIKKYKNTLVELFTNEYHSNKYPDSNVEIKFSIKDLIKQPK